MKKLKELACVTVVLFMGMAVASCGSSTGAPEPNQTSPKPSSECAKFVSEAPCGKYTSTAGSDDGTSIPWVTEGEVTAQLFHNGGNTHLVVVMPCAPLDAVVTVNGSTMRLTGQRALGASGCGEPQSEWKAWVLQFLEGSVEMGYSNNTLTWANGKDSLSFVTR
jgi:hypothetical protein